jgi:short subunit dehydrogenase-like uncharacterized protein
MRHASVYDARMREYDLVVFGATGFTGRLVAEYLKTRAPGTWAIAGRSHDKLAALGLGVPILVADALDPAACAQIARRAKVVCTTVGPYAKYGSALVAACADAGTHYCDLTGEVPWMREMIDAHHERARQTGARIVHTCGFDSIPSDLGAWATQQEFIRRYGHPAHEVTAHYVDVSGGFSGGTVASAFGLAEAMNDPAIRRLLRNPYALDPDRDAPHPHVDDQRPLGWSKRLRRVTVPFVMASTNAPVVRRGHALAGFPWGHDFVYREVMAPKNPVVAAATLATLGGLAAAMRRPRLREMLRARAPKPGDGPSAERRAHGHWKVRLVAEHGSEVMEYVVADPHGDPGYQSTAKMLGESALSLAQDELTSAGGVTTPSVAMNGKLVARLRAAGLTFAPAEK